MIVVERDIAAPADRVWALVGDLENWDRMLPTMQRVTRLAPEGPTGVASRFEVRQPGLPKAVYEVTEWAPGKGFTWVASAPGVRTTASHWLREQGGGTRLTLRLEWAGPLFRLIRLLMGSKAQRMVEQEAATFASLAEN